MGAFSRNHGLLDRSSCATASPFIDPAAREHLAWLGRPTLIIAGFATEVVVLHAALEALREGYGVIVAVDAWGAMSDRTESAAERFWSPNYIQHSAHIEPGRDGLFNLIKAAPPSLKYEPG